MASSAIGPGVSVCMSPVRSLSGGFNILGLMNTSPIAFQSQMIWGLVYQVKVLKVGVPDVLSFV